MHAINLRDYSNEPVKLVYGREDGLTRVTTMTGKPLGIVDCRRSYVDLCQQINAAKQRRADHRKRVATFWGWSAWMFTLGTAFGALLYAAVTR